jgi:DnaJ-domain-containing protein 1
MTRSGSSRNSSGLTGLNGLSTNLYRILGLRPGADGKKIKAAYRALVKQFHPDVSVDSRAEPLTKEINRAYETLGDPETRTAYDAALKRRRAAARARNVKAVTTGMAAFLLTLSLIPMVVLLKLHRPTLRSQIPERTASDETVPLVAGSERAEFGERAVQERQSIPPPAMGSSIASERAPVARRPEAPSSGEPARTESVDGEARTGDHEGSWPTPKKAAVDAPSPERSTVLVPETVASARVAPANSETANKPSSIVVGELLAQGEPTVGAAPALSGTKPRTWALYRNARVGFALKYPADVFALGGSEIDRDDRLLISKDGRALLRISVMPNDPRNTVAQFRRSLIAERYADARFDYTHQRDNWFVLSGSVGEERFYERITFSCDQRSIHGWLLVYPITERSSFDAIVEEMHRGYRYDADTGGRCGEPGPARTHVPSTGSTDVTMSAQ